MTTTNKKEITRRNGRGSRKSEKVTANDLQKVINGVSVPAPSGSGVGSAASGSLNSSPEISVGSSSASSRRAARLDMRAKLENSLRFEGFKLSRGVRELSADIVSNFAVPEWAEYETTEKTLRATFPTWSDEMITAAVRGAAKNAGVDLTAPACSVGRVLALIRYGVDVPGTTADGTPKTEHRDYLKEFVSLVGMSFAAVVAHIRENGLNNYSWRLSVSVVRSNSVLSDFVDSVPVSAGASASAVVAALLSLREVSEFNRRLSAARSSDRIDYRTYIGLAVRLAKRLGYDMDGVLHDVRSDYNYSSTSDYKERKQLRANLEKAVLRINGANDLILSLGGVTVLEADNCTAKTARAIKSALKERSRAYSVASTIDKLLQM